MNHELYIAADHHAVPTKAAIDEFLHQLGYSVHDFGTDLAADPVDYPEYAAKVAQAVSEDPAKRRGILLCGTGIGVCMVANRFAYVLAAQVWNEDQARRASNDDHVNVLCLAADYLNQDQCVGLIDIWLKTAFSDDARHLRRLAAVAALDKNR